MRARKHLLRDVFVLTLPLLAILIYFVTATAASFYNAEVKNFHGYLVRNVRIAGPAGIARAVLEPVARPTVERYLPLSKPKPGSARRFDLRVRGAVLDKLASALPASGENWQRAFLVESGGLHRVQVRHRGQAFGNFFRRQKTWKIKTRKRGLIEGYRVINLTPLEGSRLPDHLAFMAARLIGLPASRSRVVHLYLNRKDQGLYLQEEQVDESMMRRCGRMPGDVFYGEVSIPNEAKLGSNDLFWNPFLWRKKAVYNRYPEDHRPYLTELLDLVHDPALKSWDRLYELLDDQYLRYFGMLSYFGDQHTDRAHNHKLYFNPLTGKFEGISWNVIVTMPDGFGVETMANALFVKLCRDPRFLDRVHRVMHERFIAPDVPGKIIAEAERVLETFGGEALEAASFERYVRRTQEQIRGRARTVRTRLGVGEVTFAAERNGFAAYARCAASLRLETVELDGDAAGVRLWEDRNFDGVVSDGDREVRVRADGNTLRIEGGVRLYTGRDFRAPYYEPRMKRGDTFAQYRMYTRLAYLRSPFVLDGAPGKVRRVTGISAARTLGTGPVAVHAGKPTGYVAEHTIHPWRFPPAPAPRTHKFEGTVKISEDLVVTERDRLEVKPGTRFLLGPGVSILIRSRVDLSGITVDRLDPERPWGVFILQGAGASGSRIADSTMRGGSEATIGHVYYSGMFSAHYADQVVLRNCVFADNLAGDDTVRFGRCRKLRIENCRVEGANGDAIDCDISDGVITGTTVVDPRNDGIDLMTANVDLIRSTVSGAGDKGISFGEAADPQVRDCKLIDCVMGIGLKDGSNPTLRNVLISGCQTGISGYDKNWRYPGGGAGSLIDCRLTNNGKDLSLDASSILRLVRCRVDAGFTPPAAAVEDGRLEIVDLIEDPK